MGGRQSILWAKRAGGWEDEWVNGWECGWVGGWVGDLDEILNDLEVLDVLHEPAEEGEEVFASHSPERHAAVCIGERWVGGWVGLEGKGERGGSNEVLDSMGWVGGWVGGWDVPESFDSRGNEIVPSLERLPKWTETCGGWFD